MTPDDKSNLIKDLARLQGFDRVGITCPVPLQSVTYYRDWRARGYAGGMRYLSENIEIRENPKSLLVGARSIICVAVNYHHIPDSDGEWEDVPGNRGTISNYVRGNDYHVVLWEMLKGLAERIRERLQETFQYRVCVDTAPVLERELAANAGLGWIGKNTLLMHQSTGSYLFLGELVTTLELTPDTPMTDHCGNCTRCIDACPTRAIVAPYRLNASRCISYLTVEHRGNIPADLRKDMGRWVYGCDICQQVCPYNRQAPETKHPEFRSERLPATIPLLPLIRLRSGEYRRLVRGTAGGRATRQMWHRNARIALGNSADLTPEERAVLNDDTLEDES